MRPPPRVPRPSCFSAAVAAALIVLATGAEGTAWAQSDADRATARTLGQDGQKALAAQDFKTAEDDFRRADKLVHAPTLMLGLARALAGEGKFVEAQETYNRIVREGVPAGASEAFTRALEEAKTEVKSVEPRLGGVTIIVKAASGGDVPDVSVVIDDAPVNAASLGVRRAVDPGDHVLRASAPGYKPVELKVTIAAGASATAALALEKDPNAAPAPGGPAPAPGPAGPAGADTGSGGGRSILPWVAFGVGGAGLVVGAVAGGLALGKHSDLSNNCPGGTCGPAQQGELGSYHDLGTVSTVGFVVGGVGAAAGVVLLLVQPGASSAPASGSGPHVVPVVGLGTLGAAGTF